MLGWYFSAVLMLLAGILDAVQSISCNEAVNTHSFWVFVIGAGIALYIGTNKEEGNKKGDK